MAVVMAVPQTVILPTGIVQVKAADTENGLKTGVALTKAEWGQNWSGTYIKFTEMDRSASTSSDYCSKINKVVVNDKEYPVYDEERKDNYYSMTYSEGLCIYMDQSKMAKIRSLFQQMVTKIKDHCECRQNSKNSNFRFTGRFGIRRCSNR